MIPLHSMHCANIVQDALLPNRFCQDPYGFCPWDPQAERILSVCCSNFDIGKYFWIISFNIFDTSKPKNKYFPGSTSVQILFSTRTVLGKEQAKSLPSGFALAFDRHAKPFASSFDAYSSSWTSGISCSLLFKFITNLFDPWEILTQEWVLSLLKDIILISTPYSPCKQQVATSNTAQFGCSLGSILLVVMTLHLLEEYFQDKPLYWIVSNLQCLSSWISVRSPQHSEILHSFRIYSIYLVVTTSQFALHIVGIEIFEMLGHHSPKKLMSWSHWARLIAPSPYQVALIDRERVRILHTCLRLLRKDWAGLQKQLCEK